MSFYTVGLDDNLGTVRSNAALGRKYTSFLKVKVSGNINLSLSVLETLLETAEEDQVWAIDANASWTPAIALQFLEWFSTKKLCHEKVSEVEDTIEANGKRQRVERKSEESGEAKQKHPSIFMIEQPFPYDNCGPCGIFNHRNQSSAWSSGVYRQ